MLAGLMLIAAGIGILWTARDAGSVGADFARRQARNARSERARRWLGFQARVTPQTTVSYGRVVAALAIVGGIVLIVRA